MNTELHQRMPAEWEEHQGTILTWPHDERHWPKLFDQVPAIWARMVKELEKGEEVHLVMSNEEVEKSAIRELEKVHIEGKRVHFHRIPNNFPWVRDHGPIVVKDEEGRRTFLDWTFTAHGNNWDYVLDDNVPTELAKKLSFPSRKKSMVLEGGSIESNGEGTLLTTENCLLNPNRNPNLNKEEIEHELCTELGMKKILWLGEGIQGDDTSGHIDDLTRFVGPKKVVTIISDNTTDPDFTPLQENLKRLQAMTNQDGESLEIITITQPKPIFVQNFRIPASYANFYIANECVLLPVWNDSEDKNAITALERCFPSKRIVPIDSRILTWGLGSFHCVTQQIPA